jgi:hypothetical protein
MRQARGESGMEKRGKNSLEKGAENLRQDVVVVTVLRRRSGRAGIRNAGKEESIPGGKALKFTPRFNLVGQDEPALSEVERVEPHASPNNLPHRRLQRCRQNNIRERISPEHWRRSFPKR